MKKYLLPPLSGGKFYKANLHCHSTVSDGKLTPLELKEAYKKEGYGIVAFTDHELLQEHAELNDESFVALTGYEVAFCEEKEGPWKYKKNCHLNCFAKDPKNTRIVGFHPSNFWLCGEDVYGKQEYVGEPYKHDYSIEGVNRFIKDASENGFLVSYNHPVWSCEGYNEYTNYEGCFAMEIYNYASDLLSGMDYAPIAYDEMLRSGKCGRLFAVAGDDNHTGGGLDDSFGGITMIFAEELNYANVIDSLEKGRFYTKMKNSPEIYSAYYEDGKVILEFSNARDVYMRTGCRSFAGIHMKDEPLTRAEFTVKSDDTYVRFDIVGMDGSHTNTNAFFIDELIND